MMFAAHPSAGCAADVWPWVQVPGGRVHVNVNVHNLHCRDVDASVYACLMCLLTCLIWL